MYASYIYVCVCVCVCVCVYIYIYVCMYTHTDIYTSIYFFHSNQNRYLGILPQGLKCIPGFPSRILEISCPINIREIISMTT